MQNGAGSPALIGAAHGDVTRALIFCTHRRRRCHGTCVQRGGRIHHGNRVVVVAGRVERNVHVAERHEDARVEDGEQRDDGRYDDDAASGREERLGAMRHADDAETLGGDGDDHPRAAVRRCERATRQDGATSEAQVKRGRQETRKRRAKRYSTEQ